MAQCLRSGCKREAWADSETGERSHFCLDDAWKRVISKKGKGILLSEAQQAVFNSEFQEALTSTAVFPLFYHEARARKRYRSQHRLTEYYCLDCGRPIVTSANGYCGEHQKARGIEAETAKLLKIRCFNRNKYANQECWESVLVDEAWTLPDGNRYCPPCGLKIQHMSPEWRKDWGYAF
jgi:hypothetical protein